MFNQKLLSNLLLIIGLVIAGYLGYILISKMPTNKDREIIKEQQAEIERLKEILLLEQESRKIEAALRADERTKEAAAYKSLSRLKKADSLQQVRTIKNLMTKYKTYNEPALDSALIAEYEKAIRSNP